MKRCDVLLRFPSAVLLVAYLVICIRYRSFWPWNLTVHEDGRHSLWGTVFYFEHALGELPLEWLLALSVAGAVLWCAGESASGRIAGIAIAAVGLDVLVMAGAWQVTGARGFLTWLLQYHTRDGERLVFGSHWRYHLLSEASLMLLALALSVWGVTSSGKAPRPSLFWMGGAAFAALTAVFGWNGAPFRDARYLGHEVRETVTHALVTVPLAVGLCLRMAGGGAGQRTPWRGEWAFAGFALLAAYQATGAVVAGSRSQAQSSDLVSVLFVHFFEHVLSYAVVATHAVLFYAVASGNCPWQGMRSARR
jgi:hypothetical protein